MGDNQFINRFCARGIRFIIKEDILRNRIVLFYFETPFIISVYFISTQNTWYWLDIDSNYCRPNFYLYWPILMSKSTRMNWASSARVTESSEISVFIWDDLVLAAKSFKECTSNQFVQVFSFFDSVYFRPNFYFYWPTLTHIDWASSARVTESLEISVFIWNDLVLATKSFKEYNPNQLWQILLQILTQFITGQTSTSTGRPSLIWAGPPLQGWPNP